MEEPEVIMHVSEDQKEVTVVIKHTKALSTEDICTELEFLAHVMSKAQSELSQPGVVKH